MLDYLEWPAQVKEKVMIAYLISRPLPALIMVVALSACSSTATVMDAVSLSERLHVRYEINYATQVADDYKRLFEIELRDELVNVGLLAPEGAGKTNKVSINFLTFRLRDDGSRLIAGIFAGTDEIKSEVVVSNSDGEKIGRGVITTSNASSWGTNAYYLEEHARDISAFVNGGGDSSSVPFTTSPLID